MKKKVLVIFLTLAGFTASAQQYFAATEDTDFLMFGILDADGDQNNWDIYNMSTTELYEQGYALLSYSYDTYNGHPLTPDNFIFTPMLDMSNVSGPLMLSFSVGSVASTASGWYDEFLSVYIFDGVTNFSEALATPIHSQYVTEGQHMFSYTYDISSFAGADSLFIAFRHYNCTDEEAIVLDDIFITGGLGMNENSLAVAASVFPNPAIDVLNIAAKEEEIASVVILSPDGRIVQETPGSSVEVAELPSGTYFYRAVMLSGKVAQGNFVKQ